MHFYNFHLGDYAKHTKHLTLLEDLAYRRMLDLYYTTEQPLPLKPEKIARLIGMRDQIKEVADVLSDFFMKSDDGWKNNRCEEEIQTYLQKCHRARAANKIRWGTKSDPTSDPILDLNSDPNGYEIRKLSDPPIPIPTPIPQKPFSSKKKKESWPEGFELSKERRAKAEAYWQKHGVPIDVILKWDQFKSHHLAHGSMFKNWDDAWETWYQRAVEYSGNGKRQNAHADKCMMRIKSEKFRFANCGKPSAGLLGGKAYCQEHFTELQVNQ